MTRVRQGVGGALSALTSPSDIDDAWHDLHDAKPDGWYVGRPSYDEGRRVWEQYAFDPSERAHGGARSREWAAVAPTEHEVVRELALPPAADPRGANAGVAAAPDVRCASQPPQESGLPGAEPGDP